MTAKTDRPQRPAWPPRLVVFATCWLVSLVLLVSAVGGMGYATLLPRLMPMTALDSPIAYDPELSIVADREKFRRELAPIIENKESTESKALAILEWVMNQFARTENWAAASSWEMVEHGRAGGGLICGGLAQVFHDALIANGIPARRVLLQRNVFDIHDSHATVEVLVGGRWRVYDPTFHVSVKVDGSRIGAIGMRKRLLIGKGEGVEVEFLGDVKYPARIETYPLRYEAHFDNVYIELKRSTGFVRALPFLGPWLGPQWGYQGDDPGLSTGAQDFYRVLYYTTLVVLPAINLLLLLAVILMWGRFRRAGA